ncbi:MAG: hypothetical protein HC876_23640 [Chloroflexaceae bacterium]|nr:hypothetical protein [Chloroflexaceae bacterium]
MTEQTQAQSKHPQTRLKEWLDAWPGVRREIEELIASHAERDPSLHFELTLAELELKDITESVQRAAALGKLLHVDDLTSAELQATGTTKQFTALQSGGVGVSTLAYISFIVLAFAAKRQEPTL